MASLHSDTASSGRCCRLRRDAPGPGKTRGAGLGREGVSPEPGGSLGWGGCVLRAREGRGEGGWRGVNGLGRMGGGGGEGGRGGKDGQEGEEDGKGKDGGGKHG